MIDTLFFWVIICIYGISFVWFILLYARPNLKNTLSAGSGKPRSILNYLVSLAIFFAPVFLALLIQPHLPIPQVISLPIGLILIFLAVYIEIRARMKIGFLPGGPFPGLRKEETLITTGIYGLIRHPIYVGVTLWQIGFTLAFNAEFAFFFFLLYTLVYIPIIYLEEKELEEKYGEQYKEYRKRTPARLIPKIF